MIEREQKSGLGKVRKYAEKQRMKKKPAKKLTQLQNKLHFCTIKDDASEGETRPVCGAIYEEDESDSLWISCDNCDFWYCLKYTNVSEDNIPDVYHCDRC